MPPSRYSSRLLFAASVFCTTHAAAQVSTVPQDFNGIWQLNDKQSDSAADITQRLHAEKKREEAPSSRSASANAGANGTPSSPRSNGFGGRGMGGGGMGGGHMGGGHRSHQGSQDASSSSSSAPSKDPTPPLLAHDSFLNVQQNAQGLRVDFNNTDRLDTRFDGVERQSFNSNARVQTRPTSSGLAISMTFDDGTQLDQSWVRSPDGHHLTVTETWKPEDLKEPVTFKRSYDRLDL
jgi:hypothetical protein